MSVQAKRYKIPARMSFQQYQQLRSQQTLLTQLKAEKRWLQTQLEVRRIIVNRMLR